VYKRAFLDVLNNALQSSVAYFFWAVVLQKVYEYLISRYIPRHLKNCCWKTHVHVHACATKRRTEVELGKL